MNNSDHVTTLMSSSFSGDRTSSTTTNTNTNMDLSSNIINEEEIKMSYQQVLHTIQMSALKDHRPVPRLVAD